MSAAAACVLRETEVCKAKREGLYLQSGYQTDKNPQLEEFGYVCPGTHTQQGQIKRHPATAAIIFAMRVMQMTQ